MLAHERIGSGEPLVLVHGISHRRQAWYPIAERLAEHREVILFDLPGHGESPALAADGRHVKDVLQEELVNLFFELDLHRPHIAGNSLGGRIALEAAADGLVSSATGLSPAGFWKGERDFAYIRAHFAVLQATGRLARPIAPTLARPALGRKLMMATLMTRGHRLSPEHIVGDLNCMVAARPALKRIIREGVPFDGDIDWSEVIEAFDDCRLLRALTQPADQRKRHVTVRAAADLEILAAARLRQLNQ